MNAILALVVSSSAVGALAITEPLGSAYVGIDGSIDSFTLAGEPIFSWGDTLADWAVTNQREMVIVRFGVPEPAQASFLQEPIYLQGGNFRFFSDVFIFDSRMPSNDFESALTQIYNVEDDPGGSPHLRFVDITPEFRERVNSMSWLDFAFINDPGAIGLEGLHPASFNNGHLLVDSTSELLLSGIVVPRFVSAQETPEPSSWLIWLAAAWITLGYSCSRRHYARRAA